jgi:ABC-type phosphate transport system substrate-binding protein
MRTPSRRLLGMAVVLGALIAAVPAATAEEIIFIANNSVKTSQISRSEARDVFLGDSSSLRGSHAVPAVLQTGEVHEAFLQFVGRSKSAFQATWRKQVFTGKGMMPHTCNDEDALISYVSATPGAIGYVSGNKAASGVKVLKLR